MPHPSATASWHNLAFACLFFGLLATVAGMVGMWQTLPTVSWPSVMGTVLESDVGSATRGAPARPHIRYTYEVRGKRYQGSRIAYFGLTTDRRTRETVEMYPKGSLLPVYYDPHTPRRAVLEPGGVHRGVSFFLCGLLLLLLSSWIRKRHPLDSQATTPLSTSTASAP